MKRAIIITSATRRCLPARALEQPRMENILATMMSALGIDWTKEIRNTPSGRAFPYVDPLGPNGYIPIDEISSIYG